MSEHASMTLPAPVPADEVAAGPSGAESVVAVVGLATYLFYEAEKGVNERVRDYWDALHYITTCLSVGYANLFPVTPLGKLIGAAVMTIGPALSARALSPARPEPAPADPALLAKLDDVLAELKRIGGRGA